MDNFIASSPVKSSSPGVSRSRKSCTPFHKVVWELFSISIWAHSNDYVRSDQALGFHGGCFPALQAYIVPCASMFMSDHLFSVGKDIPQCPVDRASIINKTCAIGII